MTTEQKTILENLVAKYGGGVEMKLVGEDGNAFAILGRFSGQAKRCGWSQEDINAVTQIAMSGDYDNLLQTVMTVSDDRDDDENAD